MVIQGTIKELSGKYRIGSLPLDGAMLSVLTRLGEQVGFAKAVQNERVHSRGRTSKTWELSLPDNWDVASA